MKRSTIYANEKFGRMRALRRGDDYVDSRGYKNEQWWFECDCGNVVLWRPSTVRWNARKGWGCCSACVWCIRAAGEPRAVEVAQ